MKHVWRWKGKPKWGCTISLGRLQYIRWVTTGPTQKKKTKTNSLSSGEHCIFSAEVALFRGPSVHKSKQCTHSTNAIYLNILWSIVTGLWMQFLLIWTEYFLRYLCLMCVRTVACSNFQTLNRFCFCITYIRLTEPIIFFFTDWRRHS
jgi:hypothetical protein